MKNTIYEYKPISMAAGGAANKTSPKSPATLVIPTLVDPEKEKQIGTKKMLLTTVLHG